MNNGAVAVISWCVCAAAFACALYRGRAKPRNTPWEPHYALRHVRLITGEIKWGLVMGRWCEGKREFRKATPIEAEQYAKYDA